MISIEKQQGLFVAISNKLKEKITVYAIGGTAMMFLGFKDSTLDIDLVFENKKDKEIFKEAIKSLGYKEFDAKILYGRRDNVPEVLTLGDERFDLFVEDVIDFVFSESMKKRASQTHQFGDKFTLKVADPQDIVLMKCATDRMKDIDDARNIIGNREINWDLILGEAKNQVKLGRKRAAFDLGYFIERIENQFKIKVPKRVSDEICRIVTKRIKPKNKT